MQRFRPIAERFYHVAALAIFFSALALALVLGLPEEVPRRAEIISVSFAVVAFSIFVQGLTITPLLRALGEIPADDSKS